MRDTYDFVVIGSGIAGSSTAMALSRVGFKVLVVERGTHPRFAIGESVVHATTAGFDELARQYGIPELRNVFCYPGLKHAGCAGLAKLHFWFGVHRPGEPLRDADQTVLETSRLPLGPDVHMVRADVDGYLVRSLPRYGVDYLDRTTVDDFEPGDRDVRLRLTNAAGSREVRARFAVDCSGHKSLLADKYGLREEPTRLHTNTRTIFAHFRGIRSLEEVCGGQNPAFPFERDRGTMHHCFEGGWIWVIPFDNGITSVGIVLDGRTYPIASAGTPEEEWQSILDRYPTVKAHLGDAQPLQPLVRTGRLQYSSRSIIGDGFILSSHAAGFIDALFSSGLTLTMMFISRFVPLAKEALRDRDASPRQLAEAFRPLDTAFQRELDQVDRVVDGSVQSFRNFDVFKQYWRYWSHSSLMQHVLRVAGHPERPDGTGLAFGAALDSWRDVGLRMYDVVTDKSLSDAEAAVRLKAIMDEQPVAYASADFAIGSDMACNCSVVDHSLDGWYRQLLNSPEVAYDCSQKRILLFVSRMIGRSLALKVRYRLSQLRGTRFHKDIDLIRSGFTQRNQAASAMTPFGS